jgi:hypothetical protein
MTRHSGPGLDHLTFSFKMRILFADLLYRNSHRLTHNGSWEYIPFPCCTSSENHIGTIAVLDYVPDKTSLVLLQ